MVLTLTTIRASPSPLLHVPCHVPVKSRALEAADFSGCCDKAKTAGISKKAMHATSTRHRSVFRISTGNLRLQAARSFQTGDLSFKSGVLGLWRRKNTYSIWLLSGAKFGIRL
jgi:hypothetical protein